MIQNPRDQPCNVKFVDRNKTTLRRFDESTILDLAALF